MENAFARRCNADGSIDLVCASCFCTVASSTHAAGLDAHERSHICEPSQLADIHRMLGASSRIDE